VCNCCGHWKKRVLKFKSVYSLDPLRFITEPSHVLVGYSDSFLVFYRYTRVQRTYVL